MRTTSIVLSGILAAFVGFSYALATSSGTTEESASLGAQSRAVGTVRFPLEFTTALLANSTDRDLGDAAIGSVITRHITARGGFPPRRYSSDTVNSEFKGNITLDAAIKALPANFSPQQSTALLYLDGILKGAIGGPFAGATAETQLRFDVTVADSRGTNPNTKTETFRLNMVDSSTFKFAQTKLHDGRTFRQYHEHVQVIAGNPPYNFSASQITVTGTDGVVKSVATLEEVGLFFRPKIGKLVGRPLLAGTYSFLASCTDSKGTAAKSRDKQSTGQVVTFNIQQSPRVASSLFATAMTIKGDIAAGGGDSIKYSGIVDLTGTPLSQLRDEDVTLQIGDYVSPTVKLDGKGKGVNDARTMSVSITSDGLIKISVAKDSFGKDGTIIKDKELQQSLKILAVELIIGNSFETSELLKFGVKARGGKFDLTYKFGPGNLGGGFLITSVTGKDDTKEGPDADAWKVSFIALPPNEQKFDTAVTATVGIATDFTDTINVSVKNGKLRETEKRDPKGPTIVKFALDAKGKGGLTTGFLPKDSAIVDRETDIPEALNSRKRGRFPVIITLNNAAGKEVFGVEGSRAIFPKGTSWVSKNLEK